MTVTGPGGVRVRPSAGHAFRSDRAELSAALLVSERQAEVWFGLAAALDGLPLTAAAFERGDLSSRHVSEIVAATAPLERDQRAELEQQAVPLEMSVTPPRLRRRLHAMAERLDEGAAVARDPTARTTRDAWMEPGRDGMAYVTQHCPAVEAVAASTGWVAAARTTTTSRIFARDTTTSSTTPGGATSTSAPTASFSGSRPRDAPTARSPR
jgi:hypothetical protein